MKPSSTKLAFDLTPTRIGYDEFRRRYHLLREIGEFHAPGECDLRATRDAVTHERSGYEMIVPSEIIAAWVRHDFDRVVRGEPVPWAAL